MRGWTIGPLGAVILVFLLGGCAYFMIARGGGDSDEDLVRAYYRDQGASKEFASRIEVGECEYTGVDVRSTGVYRCPLTVAGQDVPGACFAIDDDAGKVVAGPRQLASAEGCRPVILELK